MSLSVVLAVAPFGPIQYPALAPSLIRAELRAAGIECGLEYLAFEFADRIGFDDYLRTYYADPPLLLGERIFARALFGDATLPIEEYWERVVVPFARPFSAHFLQRSQFDQRLHFLLRAEKEAIDFADRAAERLAATGADLVGFSSSFAQHAASLAIARRLKALRPDTRIAFGGANCFSEMGEETLAAFPFVDFVCTGEAEPVFVPLLRALERGERPALPGLLARGPAPPSAAPAPLARLDDLPAPDFSAFFAEIARRPAERSRVLAIPLEGARGCWWGEHHHCVFCGILPEHMPFRRKSPERFHAELVAAVRETGVRDVWATDYILDPAAIVDLLPLLEQDRVHREIFFEVKANLDRAQLAALAHAGATRLQPGIESLDSAVLKLMRKGTTAWQNLQLLKWAAELGVALQWNILCGFPGEDPESYRNMERLVPLIPHFPPPKAFSQITIDRGSPLFREPEAFGIQLEPARAYRYVYALPDAARRRLAYFHSHRGPGGLDTSASVAVPSYASALAQQVRVWESLHGRVRLEWAEPEPGRVEIADTRPGRGPERRDLVGLERDVFLALDAASGRRGLRTALARRGVDAKDADVDAALAALMDAALVVTVDERWLALPIRRDATVESAAHA